MARYIYSYLSICLLVFLSFSCLKKQETNSSSFSNKKITLLNDSLKSLDSLVLKHRTTDFLLSRVYARQSITIAMKLNTTKAIVRSYNILGNAYSLSQMDSAFYFYNKAIFILDSTGTSYLKNKVLYNLSMLYASAHDFKSAIVLLDSSLLLSKMEGDANTISTSLNSLGNIYLKLNDTSTARKMFDSAYSVAKNSSLFLEMGLSQGNLSQFQTNSHKSIQLLKEAIQLVQKSRTFDDRLAMLYTNLGNCYSIPDSAIFYYNLALKTVRQENAPELVIGIYNNLACSYSDKEDLNKAEECILNYAMPISKKTKNYDWLSTVYETYSEILTKKGRLADALKYEKSALEAMRTANSQSATEQVRLIAAILDLKNKEALIIENKIEIERSHLAIKARNRLVFILILFSLTILVILLFWIQRKRIQLQRNQISSAKKIIGAEEAEKAKISRDFHDLTGFKFAALKEKVETTQFPDQSKKLEILEMLMDIRHSVREISHRMSPSWLTHYPLEKNILGLCEDCRNLTSMNVQFTVRNAIPQLEEDIKLHSFRIVQELLTNSIKYASNAQVLIDLSFIDNILILKYKDDGPGFDINAAIKNGIGLGNIFERVNLLRGKVEFSSRAEFGTLFEISIPIDKKTEI